MMQLIYKIGVILCQKCNLVPHCFIFADLHSQIPIHLLDGHLHTLPLLLSGLDLVLQSADAVFVGFDVHDFK